MLARHMPVSSNSEGSEGELGVTIVGGIANGLQQTGSAIAAE